MYQGKFSSKDKKGSVPQRMETEVNPNVNVGFPENPAPQPRPVPPQGTPGGSDGRPVQRMPIGPDGRPVQRMPIGPDGRPVQRMPVGPNGRPAQRMPVGPDGRPVPGYSRPPVENPVMAQPPRKRHYGGLIFYTIFFACILAIYTFTYFKLGDLQDWLVRYEAAQPTQKYEEIFAAYFEHPNWGLLYDNAKNVEDTAYEGRDAFVAYMEQKVGDTPLTGLETSAGLSKNKKYVVRLGDEKVASFTLVDQNNATEVTDIPNWQLGEIELFYERENTYYIKTLQGQQVQVNGIPLEESNTIRIATTKANEYLPEGVTAPLSAVHQVDGLMVAPQVTVTDASGNQVQVSYDEASRTYTVPALTVQEIGESEKEWALDAIKTYAMYMSVKGGMEEELAKYFQRGTDLFKTFTSMERTWNQRYSDHSFSDDSVKDYVRYNDELFSARVSTNLHLVRGDGSEKVTLLDQSMFFKKIDGQWKCYEMTAVNVGDPVEKVRLTFKNGDQILQSDFVETTVSQVNCPAIEVPEGKTFSGWMVEDRNENGERVMRVMLRPDENNVSSIPLDGLSPMVLMPLFE